MTERKQGTRLAITLLYESLRFALHALRVNKLRTALSVLGVTVGIFSIISVFTMVDSLEGNIRGSIESMGDNVVFVAKWPWTFGSDYPWWKYLNRPIPSVREKEFIQRKSKKAAAVCFQASTSINATYKQNSLESISLSAISYEYNRVKEFELHAGRYFSASEAAAGKAVCLVGYDVAGILFGNPSITGRHIKVNGTKMLVIGVFQREGDSFLGESVDLQIFTPVNSATNFMDVRSQQNNPSIMVKAKPNVTNNELIDELTGIMRSVRRLKPKAEENFALNQISMLINTFAQLFKVINWAGIIIGMFSILVGGFGIANIMFVSVKERTRLIGIQKSLGAKNTFILFQFLSEAVILCIIGGLIGIGLLWLLVLAVQQGGNFDIFLSIQNVLLGLGISVAIGLISGIWPAKSASNLDPVEAIRSS